MNALAVVRVQKGVGAEEMDFWARTEYIGDDTSGVLVGEDFWREPFFKFVRTRQKSTERG